MRYLTIFIFTVTIFASNILNVNIKELKNKNSVEVLFHFDTPYNGSIVQKVDKEKIIIILKDAKIRKAWLKKINTPFVYQIELVPKERDSELIIYTVEKAAVLAAKTSDGFGLKLMIKKLSPTTKTKKEKKKDSDIFLLIVGGVFSAALFILIVFMFSAKKTPKIKKKRINVENPKEKELNIRFEKSLDEHNKLALISFRGVNYLVIIGSTNILLGKYKESDIENEEDFNKLVEESQSHIENIFSQKTDNKPLNEFDLYKEKASKEF